MQRGRGGAESMTNLLPLILGAALLAFGIANGARRNVVIGVALAGTSIVGIAGPRLLPPAPGLSDERARARRAAAIILPNGVIYLALGILLRTAIPASERSGSTPLIALFAVAVGLLSTLSGLGAVVRARRPDDLPTAASDARRPDHENRGKG